MTQKITVSCPNCGNTQTHQVGVSNGSSSAQCRGCKKTFRIHMKNGDVWEVKV